jgi:hypothetical protein
VSARGRKRIVQRQIYYGNRLSWELDKVIDAAIRNMRSMSSAMAEAYARSRQERQERGEV